MNRIFLKGIVIVNAGLLPLTSDASFIETTMGTAVVNDATAAYFNPAALLLVKNTQLIPLGSIARFQTQFTGQSTAVATNFISSGSSNSVSYYYSPSFYFAYPVNNKMTLGFAAVSNFANRNPEENSILRYIQSSNTIQDYDFVPSIGWKLTEHFSLGMGINFSYLNFRLQPIIGFPGSNIADSTSSNESNGSGVGGNVGFLYQFNNGTLMGFNYRSVTTYKENGTSTFNGPISIRSNNYHFEVHTPARSVLSLHKRITQKIGLITTVQRVQWSIVKNTNIYGIATASGSIPVITNASVPYYLHDSWVFTLGGNYQVSPDWIVRMAGTYSQSPNNGNYQISTGNSYILGASLGYTVNKTFTLDGSYAHAFIQDQGIHIAGSRYLVDGTNQAARDAVSLKLTINV